MSFFSVVAERGVCYVPLRVIADERSSLGERAKRIEYPFCEVIPHKARRLAHRVYRGATIDYAPAAARSDNPEVSYYMSVFLDGVFLIKPINPPSSAALRQKWRILYRSRVQSFKESFLFQNSICAPSIRGKTEFDNGSYSLSLS